MTLNRERKQPRIKKTYYPGTRPPATPPVRPRSWARLVFLISAWTWAGTFVIGLWVYVGLIPVPLRVTEAYLTVNIQTLIVAVMSGLVCLVQARRARSSLTRLADEVSNLRADMAGFRLDTITRLTTLADEVAALTENGSNHRDQR